MRKGEKKKNKSSKFQTDSAVHLSLRQSYSSRQFQ